MSSFIRLSRRSSGSSNQAASSPGHGAQEGSLPKRLHIVVIGLVQGVGFRYFAVNEARRLSISGWVRNRLDGTVELEAQGERTALAAFVDAMKTGNDWSRVQTVQVEEIALHLGESGFRVART